MLEQRPQLGGLFRKPPKPVLWFLLALLFIWISFALALNWGGASPEIFRVVAGDSNAVLHGEVWRLVTASLLHTPAGPGAVMHILFSLLVLYFFMPTLHERWGTKRMFIFLGVASVFAYGVATLAYLVFPGAADATWFGGMVLGDACVVAWAVVSRDQKANFWFIIPMKPMVMIYIMIAWHVLSILAKSVGPEGMVAPFAAMGAGFLFGETSPLRRYWLKLKLKRLQNEVDGLTRKGKSKKKRPSHLRVIPGGAKDDDDDRVLH